MRSFSTNTLIARLALLLTFIFSRQQNELVQKLRSRQIPDQGELSFTSIAGIYSLIYCSDIGVLVNPMLVPAC
jgi:hypothetical protein